MPRRVLIDTCVWLDLAKDHHSRPIISALEELSQSGELHLIVPQTLLDEFDRNRARVEDDARKGLTSHFRLVREAVSRFAEEAHREAVLTALSSVDHTISTNREAASQALFAIEQLLRSVPAVPLSDEIMVRATARALREAAPYHRNKNSVGDAILIETYAEVVDDVRARTGDMCAFVTHNFRDFSDTQSDRRTPHPDIADLFDTAKSTYWLSLVDFLKEVGPDLMTDHHFEFGFSQQPRTLSEILDAEHLLFRQIWYNRHWNLRSQIEDGTVKVVSESELSRNPYNPQEVLDTVWAGALDAARRTEQEVGLERLGPWSDFEWGMLNGKLSALRWTLGDEWDFLDT